MAFLKLDRKIFEHPFWNENREYSKFEAWLDLVKSAQIEKSSVMYNGQVIELQRGELWASIRYLSQRWSWGNQKVRTYLKLLAELRQITHRITQGQTIITLLNFSIYNDTQGNNNTPITQGQHTDNTGTTQGQHTDNTNIRNKEVKNLRIKENEVKSGFSPPTQDEVYNYFLEKKIDEYNSKLESEKFVNFYESKGWFVGKTKMKNWKSAASGWLSRMNEFNKNTKNNGINKTGNNPNNAGKIATYDIEQGLERITKAAENGIIRGKFSHL